jgi:Na+/H+ antiporter NhaD/arsenite permease-like protein
MLIGQVGRLEFGQFILWCGPPALIALAASFLLLCWACGCIVDSGLK